jgi:hypothetical protein
LFEWLINFASIQHLYVYVYIYIYIYFFSWLYSGPCNW